MSNIGNYKKDIAEGYRLSKTTGYEDFDCWLAIAIDIAAKKLKKEPHEIYQRIDLTEAKLFYIDHDGAATFAKHIVQN